MKATAPMCRAALYRQHPLAHRQAREDVIGEMCRRLHHAPGVARGAHAPAFAEKGYEEVVSAVIAPGAGKAVGVDFHAKLTPFFSSEVDPTNCSSKHCCRIWKIVLHPPLHRAPKKKACYRLDSRLFLYYLGWLMGLEPTTTGITILDSTN